MTITTVTTAGESLSLPNVLPHLWTDDDLSHLSEAAVADIRARQKKADAAIKAATSDSERMTALNMAADVVMLNVDKVGEKARAHREKADALDARVALFGSWTERICYDALATGMPATEVSRGLRWVERLPSGEWPTNHDAAQNRASQNVRRLANRWQVTKQLPNALKAIDPEAKATPEQIEAVRAFAGSVTSPKNLTDAKLQEIAAKVASESDAPQARNVRTVYVRMTDAIASVDKMIESPKAQDLTADQRAEIVKRLTALLKRFTVAPE